MTYEEYLAVPYVVVVESVEGPDGDWTRRASHPELPGCVVEAESPIEALDRLEQLRRHRIKELLERGEPIPVPRPPLRMGVLVLDADRLDFARWLIDSGRLSDRW